MFTINRDKCNRCGICVTVCPAGIIKFKDRESFPVPFKEASTICIKCGHCVAACPQGAFIHRDMDPANCMPVATGTPFSREQVEAFLCSRRSIRAYRDKQVEREILNELIELARYAPTARNMQNISWIVISDKNELIRLGELVIDWMRHLTREHPEIARALHYHAMIEAWEKGVDRIFRGAPHLIIAHAPSRDPYAAENCAGALAYLELAAYALGLGSCWAGYFTTAARAYPPLRDRINLPPGHSCFGAVMAGYPAYRYHRIPQRNKPVIQWR